MNKKHYLYVSILSKELSFSRASELLGISQPTLSQTVKKLEREVGVDLFVRKGSDVALTQAGEKYLRYGKEILDLEKKMEDELQAIADYKRANLHIALSPSKCYTLIPEVVERFYERFPGVHLHIREQLAGELLRGIENEDFDLGVTPMPQDVTKYNCEVIMDEEVILAVPKTLSVCSELLASATRKDGKRYPAITFAKMKGQPFTVMQDWQVMQKQLVDLCAASGISIYPVLECTNNLTMITMAQKGVGACLIPSSMVPFSERMANDNIAYFSLSDELPIRKIVCISKKSRSLSEPLKHLIELMKEVG